MNRRLKRLNRNHPLRWALLVLAVLVMLAIAVVPYLIGQAAQSASNRADQSDRALGPAQQQASLGQNLANKVSVACTNKTLLKQLQALGACQTANQIHQVQGPAGPPGEPGQPGRAGAPGTPGRGITNTFISDGKLFVVYTDGKSQNLGQVAGPAGPKGTDGVSIVSTALGGTSGTDLIVSYSNNNSVDVGNVIGPKGETGATGAPGPTGPTGVPGATGSPGIPGTNGRSVSSVTINPDSHLIVSYDDGTTSDAGLVPAGPQGPPGPQGLQGIGVESVALDSGGSTGCELTFTLLNPKDNSTSTRSVPVNPLVCPIGTAAPTGGASVNSLFKGSGH